MAKHKKKKKKKVVNLEGRPDPHRALAAHILGIPESKVTKRQRREAKALNFLAHYGGNTQRFFAEELGIELAQLSVGDAAWYERVRERSDRFAGQTLKYELFDHGEVASFPTVLSGGTRFEVKNSIKHYAIFTILDGYYKGRRFING